MFRKRESCLRLLTFSLSLIVAVAAALVAAPGRALADPTYTIVVTNGNAEIARFNGSIPAICAIRGNQAGLSDFNSFSAAQGDGTVVSQSVTPSGGQLIFDVVSAGTGSINGEYHNRIGEASGFSFTVSCTANTVPVDGVTFGLTPSGVAVGDAVSLSAAVSPDGATDKTVKWGVSGTGEVQLLDASGNPVQTGTATGVLAVNVKGVKAGSVTITCTSNADNSKFATCALVVSAATHKVTATASPAEGGAAKAEPAEAAAGATVTLTATAADGYEFAGWTTETPDVTFADASKAETTFVMPGSDVAVTAAFKKKETATLTFDLAGGTLDGKTDKITMTAKAGETIKLPKAPTRDGYTFKCWKGSEYKAEAEYKVEGDHSFTAEWEKAKYTLTFDANGGSGKMDPLTAEAGSKVTLTANKFTRSGYTFNGWNTQKDGKGTAYKDKDTIELKGNMTLYAQWTKNSSSSSNKSGLANTADPASLASVAMTAAVGAGFVLAGRKRR